MAVVAAIEKGCALEELSLAEMKAFSEVIDEDVYPILTIESCLEKRCALGGVAPNQVDFAIDQAEKRLEKRYSPVVKVRGARLTDLDAIEGMVAYWSGLGENLPRMRNELVRDIDSFAVAEHHGTVTGCASLYVYDSGLAEIRSLGVEAGWQHQGQGKAIVEHLMKAGYSSEGVCTTRVPEFFMKQGLFRRRSRCCLRR